MTRGHPEADRSGVIVQTCEVRTLGRSPPAKAKGPRPKPGHGPSTRITRSSFDLKDRQTNQRVQVAADRLLTGRLRGGRSWMRDHDYWHQLFTQVSEPGQGRDEQSMAWQVLW